MKSLAIQDTLLIMLKRMCIFPGRIIIQTALYNLKWSPEMTETENIMTPDQVIAQMQILYHIKINMCLTPVQIDKTGFSLSDKEDFSQICASFFKEGNYTHEYVDVCIGSAANALGINMTIFQRTVNSVMKINQTCEKFKSKVNVCLIFHNRQKCKKKQKTMTVTTIPYCIDHIIRRMNWQ